MVQKLESEWSIDNASEKTIHEPREITEDFVLVSAIAWTSLGPAQLGIIDVCFS